MRDLLIDNNSSNNLEIKQGVDGGIYVPGLKQVDVHTYQDVLDVFSKGSSNRATASTNLNEHSSRSHLILLVTVTTTQGDSAPMKGFHNKYYNLKLYIYLINFDVIRKVIFG